MSSFPSMFPEIMPRGKGYVLCSVLLSSPRHDQNPWSSSFCLFPRTLFVRSQHLRDARLPPGVRGSSATGAKRGRTRSATRLGQDETQLTTCNA